MADEKTGTRDGYFGPYGGRFVPETLMSALAQLDREYRAAMGDEAFRAELERCLRDIAGRPKIGRAHV